MGVGLMEVCNFFFPWGGSYSELPVWSLASYCIVHLPNLDNKNLMIKVISQFSTWKLTFA